jgi:2'-5' RNA ligase
MAWIDIPIEDKHVTLVHFPNIPDRLIPEVIGILNSVVTDRTFPSPRALLKKREMFGFKKDIPAITLESSYIRELRREIVDRLERAGIHYSKDFNYNPHVSYPSDSWAPGSEVTLSSDVVFHFKIRGDKTIFKVRTREVIS